jgi:hypothetical protein
LTKCTTDQSWTGTSFEVTKGADESSTVASSTLCSAAGSSRTEGSAWGISTGLSCKCSTFALDTLGFVFEVFCFVARGLVSAFVVADAWEGAFVTNLWTGFLAATRGLLFSTPLFTLAGLVVLRGLSHETEPSAEAAAAELAGLCRPSFGDLARVGAICKRPQVYFRMPCLLNVARKRCKGTGHEWEHVEDPIQTSRYKLSHKENHLNINK